MMLAQSFSDAINESRAAVNIASAQQMLSYVFIALVVFYLVVLVKWDIVRRPLLYWAGMGANAVTLLLSLFALGGSTAVIVIHMIFNLLTILASLACAVGAVYRGQLPASMQKAMDQVQPPK